MSLCSVDRLLCHRATEKLWSAPLKHVLRQSAASAQGLHYMPTIIPLHTVKILKIGTPEIITIIVLQLELLDFTVQYCVQQMQTE